MCFNLGADNNSTIQSQKDYPIGDFTNAPNGLHTYIPNEEDVYGDLFQWGRIADGHEKRQSPLRAYGAMTTAEIGNGFKCNITDVNRPWQQVKKSSPWYGEFITTTSASNYNWTPISQINADQLWRSGYFPQNDPCAHYQVDGTYQEFWHEETDLENDSPACMAAGTTSWRTPSLDEWSDIYRGGTVSGHPSSATANNWKWDSNNGRGQEIKPDGTTTTLFLPASGYRNGPLYNQGSSSFYWSTSFIGTNAYAMTFSGGGVTPASSLNRNSGFALRCIKHQ